MRQFINDWFYNNSDDQIAYPSMRVKIIDMMFLENKSTNSKIKHNGLVKF